VGGFLREPVLDWVSLAEDPQYKISARDVKLGFDYIGQTIRFCALNGWDYVFSFSVIPFKGMPVLTEGTLRLK